MKSAIDGDTYTFLADCIDGAPAEQMVVAAFPAPKGLPEAFLDGVLMSRGTLWVPHGSDSFAAAGVAAQIDLAGPGRFQQLQAWLRTLFANMQLYAHGEQSPPQPRVFGGLAFSVGSASQKPWAEYGDGCFVLPRWTYSVGEEGAFLLLALKPHERGPGVRAFVFKELDAIQVALGGGVTMWVPPISSTKVRQLEVARWLELLGRVHDRLAAHEFEKLVVARRSEVDIVDALKDVNVLARLRREVQECTRFAFRRDNSTFLGATPEILLNKRGSVVGLDALAGTIRAQGTDRPRMSLSSETLLASAKDLREHAFVVHHIVDRLRPFCLEVKHPPDPTTRKFRNIMHLHTPISGTLHPTSDVVDIVAALHPTPAMGGVPLQPAAAWLAANEPVARGWYSAPIGWIDRMGDASFAVAIRCALIAHPSAYVYAGAGVVLESDPVAEYSETGLKQMPMMLALGVESASLRSTMAPNSSPQND